jgi:catechol 2,3-dioxygenase-like lactoylglutathione lyase family enzyme
MTNLGTRQFIALLILTTLFSCQQGKTSNNITKNKPDEAMIRITNIHHYAISVKDLKATSNWYAEMFGFTIEREFGFPDLGVEIVHLIHPTGIRIELLHSTKQEDSPDKSKDAFGAINTLGSKHIGLQVTDIQKVSDDLKAKGVKFLHELTRVELAGVTNLWILDNEGNQIEIVEPINK